MPGGTIGRSRKLAVAQVVTVLSCAAVLLSIVTSRLDHQPLPGTRTAIELIGRHRNGISPNFHQTTFRGQVQPGPPDNEMTRSL
jgi:hypothetical protein